MKTKNEQIYLNLNDALTVFGFFVYFLPFFPFNLLVGVSLRLREVVSVFVVLDRLITSSFNSKNKQTIRKCAYYHVSASMVTTYIIVARIKC